MLGEIVAEHQYNYGPQDHGPYPVVLQLGAPFETADGTATCRSAVSGVHGAEFECTSIDALGALCGAIRLMKEWLIERYAEGNYLWWIGEVDETSEESAPAPLWLVFSSRSLMTEEDRIASSNFAAEFASQTPSPDTEESRREHDEAKAKARKVRDTPIVHALATSRYRFVDAKGNSAPSETMLERPPADDFGQPYARLTETRAHSRPFPVYGETTFSAMMMALRMGWFLLNSECEHRSLRLCRADAPNNLFSATELYNGLFQHGD